MTNIVSGQGRSAERRIGLDVVRLLAVAMVALRHATAVLDITLPEPLGIDVGKVGVTIFCALSGVLVPTSSVVPSQWLWRRMARILVPYWLALGAVLVANWIVRYKPVTLASVLSQIFCIAPFTHPGQMVCVTFWFITLILICYFVAAAILRYPQALWFVIAVALEVAMLRQFDRLSLWASYLLSFLGGIVLTRASRPQRIAWFAMLPTLVILTILAPRTCYAAIGVAAAAVGCVQFQFEKPSLEALSRVTYQFYLVHGPVYVGLAKFGVDSLFTVLSVGTVLSWVFAWVLAAVEGGLVRLCRRLASTRLRGLFRGVA